MKLTKITAAAVAALTLGGAAASTGTAFAEGGPVDPPVHISGNNASIGQTFFTSDKSKQAALAHIEANSVIAADETTPISIFRMYNPNTGEHFYTVSSYEAASLLINSGWNYEGTLGKTYTTGHSTAVTRLYNKNAGVHYYTSSEYEARSLMAKGWVDEGVAFIDAGQFDVYAAYNANNSQHNYTMFLAEENSLLGAGWQPAGGMGNVAFHLVETGNPFPAADTGYAGPEGPVSNGSVLPGESTPDTASNGSGPNQTIVGDNS
ncbi:MAG: hypothetical protein LBV19_08660 [Streptococcaceae bacterium]|nr:hypothetical protein [Streptococcaceae bacterium]